MPIFDNDILTEALANFDISKLVENLDFKIKILENWIIALENGGIECLSENQNKPEFFQKIFTEVLGFEQEQSSQVKNLIVEQKTQFDSTKPDAVLGFFRLVNRKWNMSSVLAVVEVKNLGTNFKKKQRSRYSNPIMQGFEYLFKYERCEWVIITDFRTIQLYHDYIDRHEDFIISRDLIDHKEALILFFFFLHKDRLICEKSPSPLDMLILKQKNKQFEAQSIVLNEIVTIAQNMHTIDQLFLSLSKFKGLNFVNPELLANIFPFNTGDEKVYHYNSSNYAIQTINPDVFDIFSNVGIKDGKLVFKKKFDCFDYENKLNTIIELLNNSFIYRFQGYENLEIVKNYLSRPNIIAPSLKYQLGDYEKQLKTFEIKLSGEDDKNSILQLFLNLQFDKILTKIKTTEGKPEYNSFEIAYACYLIGLDDYKKSYLVLKTIYSNNSLPTDENRICRFLSCLNQKYLFGLISGHYWLDDRDEILNGIRKIDLDELIAGLDFEDAQVRNALIELKENKIFDTSKNQISENHENIYQAYELYKKGGTQYGPFYPGMQWNEFALNFTNFTSNFIFYDVFSEFSEYFQKIFDSLIISFATDNSYPGRLKEFEYYHIICAFLYLSADKTSKLFNEYEIKELNVSIENKIKIVSVVLNFLRCTHSEGKKAMFGNELENKSFTNYLTTNFRFKQTYFQIFNNIFLLISKIEVNSEGLLEIIKAVSDFVKIDRDLYWTNFDYLALFIKNQCKGNYPNAQAELLEVILENVLRNNIKSIQPPLIQEICNNIQQTNNQYRFVNETLISKVLLSFTCNNHCTYSETDILISLWQISGMSNKAEIANKFISILSLRFEPTIYTKLVYGKLIELETSTFFDSYIEAYSNYTHPIISKRKDFSFLTNYSFNYFVEFLYSQHINLKDERLKKISKLEGYYYWLLNYQNYDYKHFNPDWLLLWDTDTYLVRFSAIKEIKKCVQRKLKRKFDKKLAEIYFEFFE